MSGDNSRKALVEKFRRHEKDAGSPEVQVALLTNRLEILSQHFTKHPQDKHSQRGMQGMINQRKKLLAYLKKADSGRYKTLIGELGIRK